MCSLLNWGWKGYLGRGHLTHGHGHSHSCSLPDVVLLPPLQLQVHGILILHLSLLFFSLPLTWDPPLHRQPHRINE